MDCNKNKTLLSAALLTTDTTIKNKLISLTGKVQELETTAKLYGDTIIWKQLKQAIDSVNKELEATIYASLLTWTNRWTYKPVLLKKFQKWLRDSTYDNVVSLLETADSDIKVLSNAEYKKNEAIYNALWFSSQDEYYASVNEITDGLEHMLLTDYVYFKWPRWDEAISGRKIDPKDYEKLSKKILASDNLRQTIKSLSSTQDVYFDEFVRKEIIKNSLIKKELPLAKNSNITISYATDNRRIAAILKSENKTVLLKNSHLESAVNNYLAFLTITNPRFTTKQWLLAANMISSKDIGIVNEKAIKSVKSIGDLHTMIVSNISSFKWNEALINAAKSQYEKLATAGGKASWVIGMLQSIDGLKDNVGIQLGRILRNKREDFLKSVFEKTVYEIQKSIGWDVNVAKILRTVNKLDEDATKFVESAIKALGRTATEWDKEVARKLLNKFVQDISEQTTATDVGSFLVESLTGKKANLAKSVLYENANSIGFGLSQWNQDIVKAYDDLMQSNNIVIWQAPVQHTSVDNIFNAWVQWDVETILVKNKDDVYSPDMQSLQERIGAYIANNASAPKVPVITYPKWYGASSFFVRDGKLMIGSLDKNYINNMIKAFEDAKIPVSQENIGADIIDSTKKALQAQYWDNFEYVYKFIETNLWMKSIYDIKKELSLISNIDARYTEDFFSIADEYNKLPDNLEWFRSEAIKLANDLNIDSSAISSADISSLDVDNVKKLYLQSKFGKTTDSIVIWQNDLLSMFGMNWAFTANNIDRYNYIIKRVKDAGFEFPVNNAKQFIDFIDGKADVDNSFLTSFIAKNKEAKWFSDITSLSDIDSVENVFREAKDYVDTNIVDNIPSQLEITEGVDKYIVYSPNEYAASVRWELANMKISEDIGEYSVNAYELTQRVSGMLDRYYNSIESLIRENGWAIDNFTALTEQRKVQNALRLYESELQSIYGDIIPANSLFTQSYELKKINTVEELEYLKKTVSDLKQRYTNQFTSIEDRIKEASKWDFSNLKSGWYKLVLDGGKVRMLSIDDAINDILKKLPDDIGWLKDIKDLNLKSLPLQAKVDLHKVLEYAQSKYWQRNNPISKIYEWVDESLAWVFNNYKVTFKNWVTLPDILFKTNASRNLNASTFVEASDDLIIKESIFKKVSEIVNKSALTPEALRDIVQKEADKVFNNLPIEKAESFDMDWFVSAYYASFVPYTKVFQIPDAFINRVKEIATKADELTASQIDIARNITINTADWPSNLADISIWAIDEVKPDILYRTEQEQPLNIARVLTDDEVRNVQRNVEVNADSYLNHIKGNDDWFNAIQSNVFSQALPIMKREWGRLQNLVDLHHNLKSYAEKAHFSLVNLMPARRRIGRYLLLGSYGSAPIDSDVLMEFKAIYNKYMSMDNSEFLMLNPIAMNNAELNGYYVAWYMKKLSKNMRNISTDAVFNDTLNKSILSAVDKIKDINSLMEVATAIRNFTPFYWAKDIAFDGKWVIDVTNQFFGSNTNRDVFNRLFNTNLNLYDYRVTASALFGMQNSSMSALKKAVKWVWEKTTAPVWRMIASMPWSFFTAPLSVAWYMNEYGKLAKQWWVEFGDMKWITSFRLQNNILTQEWPDIWTTLRWLVIAASESDKPFDFIQNLSYLARDADGKLSGKAFFNNAFDRDAFDTFFTQTFDNGQNVVDAIFSSTMKNMAFLWALKSNTFHRFTGFQDFRRFMDADYIPDIMKRRVMDEVTSKSMDLFQWIINYGGSAIYRTTNAGKPWLNQLHAVSNAIHNPINFRGSLGINTIKYAANTLVTWLSAFAQIGRNWAKVWDVVKMVLEDENIQRLTYSIWWDAVNSARLARLNDKWEDISDRDVTFDDIMEAMWQLSMPWQLVQTAGISRLVNAWLDAWEHWKWAVVNSYLNNFFRQLKWVSLVAGWYRAWGQGWMEWLSEYMDNAFRTASTAAVRMFLLDRNNASTYQFVPQNKTWLWEFFWADNWYLRVWFMSNNIELEERFKRIISEDWRFDSGMLPYIWLDIINQTQVGRSIVSIIEGTKALVDWRARWFSIASKYDLEKDLSQEDAFRKFQDRWVYIVDKPWAWASSDEIREYNEEMSSIFSKITIYQWPWYVTSKWLEEWALIEKFKKWEKPSYWEAEQALWRVYESMEKNWVLDDRLSKINNTPNKERYDAWEQLSADMINYIMSLPEDERPAWYDLVILSTIAQNDYNKTSYRLLQQHKKTWLSPEQYKAVKSQVADKHYIRYQEVLSDWNFSHGGYGLMINKLMKDNPDAFTKFVEETEFTGSDWEKITSYRLKWTYKEYIEQLLKTQEETRNGANIWDATLKNFWTVNFFPSYRVDEKTGENKDSPINLAVATYMDSWIKQRDDLTPHQKTAMRVNMFSRAGIDWKDQDKVKEVLWDELFNQYKRQFFQSYNDGIEMLNDVLDDWAKSWGKWASSLSFKLDDFMKDLTKTRFSLEKNGKSFYEWIGSSKVPAPIKAIELDTTKTLRDRQKWSVNTQMFNASSESYFKSQPSVLSGKRDVSRKIKENKVSPIQLKWQKKSNKK